MKFLRRNSEVKDGCVHLNNPERAMFHPLGEVDQAALGERDPLVFEAELNYAAKRLGIVLVCSEKSEYLVGVVVGVMGRAVEGLEYQTHSILHAPSTTSLSMNAIERRISNGSR